MTGAAGLTGMTTTIPVEAVFAAGQRPVDLNNLFVASPDREEFLEIALRSGFPQSSCVWLKGIFGAVAAAGRPERVVGVVRGDCSGTELVLEALGLRGIEVIPFAYPIERERSEMERQLERLCRRLGTSTGDAEAWRERLEPAREMLREADRLCWRSNRLTGLEAHAWLVSASDFRGDPAEFERDLSGFLSRAASREPLDRRPGLPYDREVRLGYIGVPPVTTDIFPLAEELGARFVYHEVQRQFSMPDSRRARDLADQYLAFTYPYSVAGRAREIEREAGLRALDGIVHYVQSFCHRNMEDVIFSRALGLPLLTVECDCPGGLGATARSRLENFVQVLGENASS